MGGIDDLDLYQDLLGKLLQSYQEILTSSRSGLGLERVTDVDTGVWFLDYTTKYMFIIKEVGSSGFLGAKQDHLAWRNLFLEYVERTLKEPLIYCVLQSLHNTVITIVQYVK